jgi:hypothetical protein
MLNRLFIHPFQTEYQSIDNELVQPDQVIVIPEYFMRYIPLPGLDLVWLYIGLRQAFYEAGGVKQPSKKIYLRLLKKSLTFPE